MVESIFVLNPKLRPTAQALLDQSLFDEIYQGNVDIPSKKRKGVVGKVGKQNTKTPFAKMFTLARKH
jgi:hypothetical protein